MFTVFHGNIENTKSIGTNKLLKQFAKIATSPKDIVENYSFLSKNNELHENKEEENISLEYKSIYKVIGENPVEIEELIKFTNMDFKQLSSKLTMMELEGYIQRLPGNRYIRCEIEK